MCRRRRQVCADEKNHHAASGYSGSRVSAARLRPDDHARLEQPPDSLDETGQAEWTRVVGLLVERGHWDPLRSTVLFAYCESYTDWHRLTEQVRGKEVVLQGGTRRVDDQGHVTTAGGKAAPNPLLPVIARAHRSLQVALEELLRPAPWALAPTPAPSDGTQAEPEHPWLRHPDETAKAYAAFRYYRDLGEARSIRQVTQKLTVSETLAKRWSTLHAWVIRVRAWDEHQDRIAVAVSTDAIQAMRLEHADYGRSDLAAAHAILDARMQPWRDRGCVGDPPFTVIEACRLIQIGSALERTARGLDSEGPGELPGEALHHWADRIRRGDGVVGLLSDAGLLLEPEQQHPKCLGLGRREGDRVGPGVAPWCGIRRPGRPCGDGRRWRESRRARPRAAGRPGPGPGRRPCDGSRPTRGRSLPRRGPAGRRAWPETGRRPRRGRW